MQQDTITLKQLRRSERRRSCLSHVNLTYGSRIRMQARQQVADAEIGEDDEEEGDDGEVGGRAALPAAGDADVEECAVGEPRDERAGLFRVPAPVAPP